MLTAWALLAAADFSCLAQVTPTYVSSVAPPRDAEGVPPNSIIQVVLEDVNVPTNTVNANSIKLTVDSVAFEGPLLNTSRVGSQTVVTYTPTNLTAPGSVHVVIVDWVDSQGLPGTTNWTFRINRAPQLVTD